MKKYLFVITILALGLALPLVTFSAMTSTNYTIYADSVGYGGGGITTSTSYSLEVTAGEPAPIAEASSTTYEVRGGYQAMDRDDLSISVSNAAISLGSLSHQSVSSDSTVVTISALSTTGYTLSISSVANSTVPFTVTDGTVSSGSEEYGMEVTGTDSSLSGDVSVSAKTIATSANPVTGQETTVTFKGSRAEASTPGEFSQTVTFSVSANF
jgi:hypothetical protein